MLQLNEISAFEFMVSSREVSYIVTINKMINYQHPHFTTAAHMIISRAKHTIGVQNYLCYFEGHIEIGDMDII